MKKIVPSSLRYLFMCGLSLSCYRGNTKDTASPHLHLYPLLLHKSGTTKGYLTESLLFARILLTCTLPVMLVPLQKQICHVCSHTTTALLQKTVLYVDPANMAKDRSSSYVHRYVLGSHVCSGLCLCCVCCACVRLCVSCLWSV